MQLRLILLILLSFSATAQTANPVPHIDEPVSPVSVEPHTPDVALEIRGAGFVAGSVVRWDELSLSTVFQSESRLTATVPSALLRRRGTACIRVFNPEPAGGNSYEAIVAVTKPRSSFRFMVRPASGEERTCRAGAVSAAIVMRDLNADGHEDLVTLTDEGAPITHGLLVRLNNGDGTFQPDVFYSAGPFPEGVTAADFDLDGRVDIAVAVGGSDSILLFRGLGDGTLASAGVVFVWIPHVLHLGDLNGDGIVDLVRGISSDNRIFAFLGAGDFTFSQGILLEIPLEGAAREVVLADLNQDGILDMAAAAIDPQQVQQASILSVFLGNGDGTFSARVDSPLPVAAPQSIQAADLNGDNHLDLIIGFPSEVLFFLGDGVGSFSQTASFMPPDGSRPGSIATGDFNRDGRIDVLVSERFLLRQKP